MSEPEDPVIRMLDKSRELVAIVEGVRLKKWADPSGRRLKNTPEWCGFYVAFCNLADTRCVNKKTRRKHA